MNTAALIFPHQLFEDNPLFDISITTFYILEDSLFFKDEHTGIYFQKKKLQLHRATMQWYKTFLESKGYSVVYVEYDSNRTTTAIINSLEEDQLYCVEPVDFLLEKRLSRSNKKIEYLTTPYFLNTQEDNDAFLEKHPKSIMHTFYVWQRKRLNILIDAVGNPEGGSWSFDEQNRQKLPKDLYEKTPKEITCAHNDASQKNIDEAATYITTHFNDAYGTTDNFQYPITHIEAKAWFQKFLEERFSNFGPYEDAFTTEHKMLYHAVLTPSLNCGLITPAYVVKEVLDFEKAHDVPLHSVEGFIRQVIGWREYMRVMYVKHGVTMRTKNSWNFLNKLPAAFYNGTTGVVPVDTVIKNTMETGYAHHIERLMVLGNFMMLLEIDPDEVYRWFMELFIDSYDWVMVPNIYAMSQYADGGMFTTKPYISSSNYIRKMSDYKQGDWCEIWDALYWSFIIKHLEQLKKNGRMHFVVSRAEKFTQEQKDSYKEVADDFKTNIGM